jgi:hypothetical protein
MFRNADDRRNRPFRSQRGGEGELVTKAQGALVLFEKSDLDHGNIVGNYELTLAVTICAENSFFAHLRTTFPPGMLGMA